MTAREISAGGVDWQLADEGSTGVPLLLLHGNRDRKELWRSLLDEFGDRRTLAVELPCHGGTPVPGSADMADHVTALGELLDALQIPECVVIGHSLGGQLAIALAARRPDLVRALVVIGSALVHASSFKPGAAASNDDMIAHVGRLFFPDTREVPPRREQVRAEVLGTWRSVAWEHHQRLNALRRVDAAAAAALIAVPTLVMTGEHDLICPWEPSGAAIQAAIPGARQAIIADGGHFAHLEWPGPAAAAITSFLDSATAQPQAAGGRA
ncbi:MAG: alpha/beta hydrolase [Actinomycetota bacterium]|nr:alpha/beta hydrolase [Actinomycetota bacterium]